MKKSGNLNIIRKAQHLKINVQQQRNSPINGYSYPYKAQQNYINTHSKQRYNHQNVVCNAGIPSQQSKSRMEIKTSNNQGTTNCESVEH